MVLGLLFSSCSEYKADKALENCATQNYLDGDNYYLNLFLYENHPEYIAIQKKLDTFLASELNPQLKKLDNLNIKKNDVYDQWKRTNKKPKNVELKFKKDFANDEDYKNWKKKHDNWYVEMTQYNKKLQLFINPFRLEIHNLEKTIKILKGQEWDIKQEISEIKRKISKQKIPKMKLNEKRKLNNFIETFYQCEKMYKSTKKTFMLKYGS